MYIYWTIGNIHVHILTHISVMMTNLYEYYTYTENSFIALKPSHFRHYEIRNLSKGK